MFLDPIETSETQAASRKLALPTGPNKAHRWDGDALPSLRMCQTADPSAAKAEKPAVLAPTLRLRDNEPPRSGLKSLLILAAVAVSCLATYFVISQYVITAVVIQGRSMAPTLRDGERYFLNRWVYIFRAPDRGELVVLHDPGHNDFAVKRIVGVPSDVIEFRDGTVFVNGKSLQEPYLSANTVTSVPKGRDLMFKIAPKNYFVLGDNRSNSEDSRFYGQVSQDQIVGMIWK